MALFHQKITRWIGENGRRCPPRTPGAHKVVTQSRKWYGRLPGSDKPIPLSANKVVAGQMLAEKVKKAELAKVGILDPFEKERARPIAEHLEDFLARAALPRRKGKRPPSAKVLRTLRTRLERMIRECGFLVADDITEARVLAFLDGLRSGRPAPVVPSRKEFTAGEIAELTGTHLHTVQRAARRLMLPCTGTGGGRKYPRETALALVAHSCRGTGETTIGGHAAAVKRFTRYLAGRAFPRDPLAELPGQVSEGDHRHDRSALTLEQIRGVLAATKASKRSWRGLDGSTRYHLYLTAVYTGFRAGELAELTPESFGLGDDLLTVTLPARETKNNRAAIQPIPAEVADVLRAYLEDQPAGKTLWPGPWSETGAEMLYRDLMAAGIPHVTRGPDGPLWSDFHSLRHSYVRLLEEAGVSVRHAMHLARHGDPKLTLKRYARPHLEDLKREVEKLPKLVTGMVTGGLVTKGADEGGSGGKGGDAKKKRNRRKSRRDS